MQGSIQKYFNFIDKDYIAIPKVVFFHISRHSYFSPSNFQELQLQKNVENLSFEMEIKSDLRGQFQKYFNWNQQA